MLSAYLLCVRNGVPFSDNHIVHFNKIFCLVLFNKFIEEIFSPPVVILICTESDTTLHILVSGTNLVGSVSSNLPVWTVHQTMFRSW